jgi:hypothetical protein
LWQIKQIQDGVRGSQQPKQEQGRKENASGQRGQQQQLDHPNQDGSSN